MSTTGFSGSLQNKKKGELQEIAQALKLGDGGTREELQQRIKKYLDDNANELENDPEFSGLYANARGKRQRSVQPSERGSTRARSRSTEPQAVPTRIFAKVEELQTSMSSIVEEPEVETPVKDRRWSPAQDIRDVSMMLPQAPMSPVPAPRYKSLTPPQERRLPAPSPRNIPLPPTPAKSVISNAEEVIEHIEPKGAGSFSRAVGLLRSMLSSGRNIFVLTAFIDFVQILYVINTTGNPNSLASLPQNPLAATAVPILGATGLATLCWSVPTLVLPVIFGYLISSSGSATSSDSSDIGFDPLSASIVRLAATVAVDFPSVAVIGQNEMGLGDTPLTQSLDIVGLKLRIVSAAMSLAFAYAEAIKHRS